jgi:hypothetical protein
MSTGIRKLHSKGCAGRESGRCSCGVGWEASVFSKRDGISLRRLLRPDAMELLERRGVPGPWRASIAELLELIAEMDGRAKLIEAELRPLAGEDPRAELLMTMPGIGPLLGLTIAAEIGEVSRFSSPAKLVGYAGLAPRISQSGERSQTGRSRRPARGRCAGRRSRPPTRPGGRATPSTATTAGSRSATARTRRSRRRCARICAPDSQVVLIQLARQSV